MWSISFAVSQRDQNTASKLVSKCDRPTTNRSSIKPLKGQVRMQVEVQLSKWGTRGKSLWLLKSSGWTVWHAWCKQSKLLNWLNFDTCLEGHVAGTLMHSSKWLPTLTQKICQLSFCIEVAFKPKWRPAFFNRGQPWPTCHGLGKLTRRRQPWKPWISRTFFLVTANEDFETVKVQLRVASWFVKNVGHLFSENDKSFKAE